MHAAAYKLAGKRLFQGMPISIETKKGQIRSGKKSDGTKWQVRMPADYGYINFPNTRGQDGDKVDCFLGPNQAAKYVYIIHQHVYGDPDTYDEDKCMLGFDSADQAIEMYKSAYDDGQGMFQSMSMVPVEKFKKKVLATEHKQKAFKIKAGGPGSGRHKENTAEAFVYHPSRGVFSGDNGSHSDVIDKYNLPKSGWQYDSLVRGIGSVDHNNKTVSVRTVSPRGEDFTIEDAIDHFKDKYPKYKVTEERLFAGGPGSGRHPEDLLKKQQDEKDIQKWKQHFKQQPSSGKFDPSKWAEKMKQTYQPPQPAEKKLKKGVLNRYDVISRETQEGVNGRKSTVTSYIDNFAKSTKGGMEKGFRVWHNNYSEPAYVTRGAKGVGEVEVRGKKSVGETDKKVNNWLMRKGIAHDWSHESPITSSVSIASQLDGDYWQFTEKTGIQPIIPAHPPSLKNPQRVPSDNPDEDDKSTLGKMDKKYRKSDKVLKQGIEQSRRMGKPEVAQTTQFVPISQG